MPAAGAFKSQISSFCLEDVESHGGRGEGSANYRDSWKTYIEREEGTNRTHVHDLKKKEKKGRWDPVPQAVSVY